MNNGFTPEDRDVLIRFLEPLVAETDIVPELFADNLLETTDDPEFAAVLRQTVNRMNPDAVSDIEVNGWTLHEMLDEYDEEHKVIGICFSLIMLYLEKYDPQYKGFCRFAGMCFYADWRAVEAGDYIASAQFEADGFWYLFGQHTGILDMTDEEAKEKIFAVYDAFSILLDYPELIQPLSEDYPADTCIVREPGTLQYIVLEPDH